MNYEITVNSIIGRVGITKAEAEVMAKYLDDGLHIEIGTLWGGSAILASQAKPGGKVVTVDPMNSGWWLSQDPVVGIAPSHEIVNLNIERLSGCPVQSVKGYSTEYLRGHEPCSTLLIDGDHSYEAIRADWFVAREIAESYIFVHDYDELHEGVLRFIDELEDYTWYRVDQAGSMLVFGRHD